MPCARSASPVEHGELLTLLGPSGCGKSTTLRMIAGFEEPDAGTHLDRRQGRHARAAQPARHRLHVPELRAVPASLGVRERGLWPARAGPRRGRASPRRSARCWSWSGWRATSRQQPHQLSGGEQQRVALARAVVFQPKVLLFDEPLSNLDAKLRVEMREQIRALQKRIGITTVYVTHDQEEAMAISDRIAVMDTRRGGAGRHRFRSLLPAGDRVRRPLHRPHQSPGGPRRLGRRGRGRRPAHRPRARAVRPARRCGSWCGPR